MIYIFAILALCRSEMPAEMNFGKPNSVFHDSIQRSAPKDSAPLSQHLVPTSDMPEALAPPHFTLREAIKILLKTNPEIQQAKARWKASRNTHMAGWGDFEPKLTGKFNHQETTLPGPWSELKDEYKLSLEGILPTATQYDFGYRHTGAIHSSTISDAFLGLTLKQPILRGLWYDGALSNIRILADEEKKLYHQLRSEISQALGKLHSAYWDYLYSDRILQFEEQSVAIAKDLQRDGIQRIANGKISPLDLEQLSSELAIRLSRMHEARKNLEKSRNQFAVLLSSADSVIPYNFTIAAPAIPDTIPSFVPPADFDSIGSVHPDILSLNHELERAKKTLNSHKNLRLPKIDIIGSYGRTSSAKTGYSALQQFQNTPQRSMSGGVEIEIPILGNIKESYLISSENQNVRFAENRLQQYKIYYKKQSQLLANQIFTYQNKASQERISVQFHKKELESEYAKIKAGKSNIRPIYEIEEKLRDSQSRLLEAIRSYELARVELEQSNGTFLQNQGLETKTDGNYELLKEIIKAP